MTLFELIVVLLGSPLIIVLCYGAYRFHVDPDGTAPVFNGKSEKIRRKQKPGGTILAPGTMAG